MLNNFFFKTRTHKVITWQGKIIILVSVVVIVWLCWPLLRIGVTNYICYEDELHPVSRIIVENWDGDIDIFEGSAKVASSIGATEIVSIIFEDAYRDARKRKAYFLNAWAAGIDTARFSLIPVPKQEPKTLNIARTVLDTAHQRHWTELTIVTFDSSRSTIKKSVSSRSKAIYHLHPHRRSRHGRGHVTELAYNIEWVGNGIFRND